MENGNDPAMPSGLPMRRSIGATEVADRDSPERRALIACKGRAAASENGSPPPHNAAAAVARKVAARPAYVIAPAGSSDAGTRVASTPEPDTLAARDAGVTPGSQQQHHLLISRLWSTATRPDIARVYLRSRGLPCEPLSEALRGHPAVWCSEAGEDRACVLAAVEAPAAGIIALHRIWTLTVYIASEGEDARPQDLRVRKKTLGQLGDGAVRLSPATDRLGLAEGVETSLKAGALYKRAAWAVLGAQRYGHPSVRKERPDGSWYRVEERAPSIWIPKTVTDLIVFGDRDGGVGEGSAIWAAWWYCRQGLAARAVFPPEGIKDFGEMD